MVINIRVNGEEKRLEEATSLARLIESLGLDRTRIAVEHNREIAPKSLYDTTILQEGDQLEIVHFVGGGAPLARMIGC